MSWLLIGSNGDIAVKIDTSGEVEKRGHTSLVIEATFHSSCAVGQYPLALRERACDWTPPQFRIPLQARGFGFMIRHIGGN